MYGDDVGTEGHDLDLEGTDDVGRVVPSRVLAVQPRGHADRPQLPASAQLHVLVHLLNIWCYLTSSSVKRDKKNGNDIKLFSKNLRYTFTQADCPRTSEHKKTAYKYS